MLYAPIDMRPALFALHALDIELARVIATTTEPMIGEIRLAWWREALLKLDSRQVPAQPLLTAIAAHVLPRGVSGRSLERLEDGFHQTLLGGEGAIMRGAALFAALATVLETDLAAATALGEVWALGEAVRAGAGTPDAPAIGDRLPPALRPLAGLAALARRDIERSRRGHPVEPRGTTMRQAVLLRTVLIGH